MQLSNYILDGEFVALIGDFDRNYWSGKYDDFSKLTFLRSSVETFRSLSEYDFAFIADNDAGTLIFIVDEKTRIVVKIKKGTADECVDLILRVGHGWIGMDLQDLIYALGYGKKPAIYYGDINVAEVNELKNLYGTKTGLFLSAHSPAKIGLENLDLVISEIYDLCDPDVYFCWDVTFEEFLSEYRFDLMISGLEIN